MLKHKIETTGQRIIDSPVKRYLVTLFSNLTIFAASFVTAGIVPRALGPEQYGNYGFLSRVSMSFRRVLDMETSTAFFNLASRQEESGPLVKTFSIWILAQFFLIISVIVCAFLLGAGQFIWPGQVFKYVIWVAVFDWVFFLGTTLKAMADAKGFTVKAQIVNLFISIANIAVLIMLAISGWLNLGIYIAVQTSASALLSLFLILKIMLPHSDLYWKGVISGHFKHLRNYFFRYCSPLVVYGLIGFIFEYFDRMVLQRFSGSVQQGYFQIATSWAAPSALFTTSILSIYKREVAYSLGKDDNLTAGNTFSKYLKMMYFITLVFGVFIAFHASELLGLIAGEKFIAAAPALMIMAFYPAHQAYGQLGGAAFLASERTALLRNIGIAGLFISMPVTYFLIAPAGAKLPGLGMGSMGLALKSVIFNLIISQTYLVYNCRFFKLNLVSFWWHQFYCLALLAGGMFIIKAASGMVFGGFAVIRLISAFLIYISLVGIWVYMFPEVASLERFELKVLIIKAGNTISGVFKMKGKKK